MKSGLLSFVFFNYPVADVIRHTAEAGGDGIESCGGRPHVYRRDLSRHEINELVDLLRESRSAVASFIPAHCRYPPCLCRNTETIRRDSVAYS